MTTVANRRSPSSTSAWREGHWAKLEAALEPAHGDLFQPVADAPPPPVVKPTPVRSPLPLPNAFPTPRRQVVTRRISV